MTRRRIYMDTIESVLARAHKVLIDGHAGSNMIYLPIDKLLEQEQRARGRAARLKPPLRAARAKEPDQVTVEARGRGER